MASVKPGPTRSSRPSADSDVYTVLLLIALIALLAATIYVAYRAQTMFGGVLPPGGA